ncbi:MAG: hypothetical protein HY321_06030 [Armatimonadetes bacterium]|nr:hypothetical protein [Armatimonadota bacterium]
MPVTISATVPEGLRPEALQVAKARGETIADVMRHALAAYLSELREEAEDMRFADEIEARIERGERCGRNWKNWKPRARCRTDLSDETTAALCKLPGYYRAWAKREIQSPAVSPRPARAKELALKDRPNRFRTWLNQWRLIYRVDDDARVVRVIGIRLKTGPETDDDME